MFLLNTEMYSKYRYRMRGDVLMYLKGVVVLVVKLSLFFLHSQLMLRRHFNENVIMTKLTSTLGSHGRVVVRVGL